MVKITDGCLPRSLPDRGRYRKFDMRNIMQLPVREIEGPGDEMNTREAAEAIGTDARTLRRFLRAEPSYNNPGSAGRYVFEPREIPTLKRLFAKWSQTSAPSTKPATPKETVVADKPVSGSSAPEDDPHYDLEYGFFGHIPTQLTGPALKRENARVARLEAALMAAGKHISQHRPQ